MDIDIDNSMANLSIETIDSLESIHNNQIDMLIIENMNNLSMYNHDEYETYTDYDTLEMNKATECTDTNQYENQYENQYTKNSTNSVLDEYDRYDNSPYICFGIPNKYCTIHFDDEDFIFNRYDILNDMKQYIK
jgi:hypothetical protein